MHTNLPVTQKEFDYPAGATLMSTTDLSSHITYANAAFVALSGFTREELINEPHNVVRHPDMPPEAFADMWSTLKSGKSWTALVKNRRKNGDHYWVRANATPMITNGAVTGFMSVRTKPARNEVEQAEQLYRRFRDGKMGKRAFCQGLVVRTGLLRFLSAPQTMSVRWRIRLALASVAALAEVAAWACGLGGLHLAVMAGCLASMAMAGSAWLASQIATPLALVQRQALLVAAGQPGENVHLNRVDEIGMILRAVNQAGLNLRSLVDDVSEQVSGLRSASREIAQGNTDLSARTEQASSNLQQTAASMEQMTSSVRTSADTAQRALQLANTTSDAAARGGQVVDQVVGTMQTITTSSKRIADIISVIDGIAFQTNILALNAAVEAARAGEQGRGFAVVAGEVRGLATRSADAAKEIKSLINASVDEVESGAQLVGHAGDAIKDIVNQVHDVAALIGTITSSAQMQSSGIGDVNMAVSRLDQMTQLNAALVEESAAAAESLRDKASRLVEAISVFNRAS
jgi:aerotaxis receptor